MERGPHTPDVLQEKVLSSNELIAELQSRWQIPPEESAKLIATMTETSPDDGNARWRITPGLRADEFTLKRFGGQKSFVLQLGKASRLNQETGEMVSFSYPMIVQKPHEKMPEKKAGNNATGHFLPPSSPARPKKGY